jgi:hypothetical protein
LNLLNATDMPAAWTMATDPTAREHVVVVVKGTFAIPGDGGPVERVSVQDQVPLVMADTFTGAPGFSAPVHEADFCLRKRRCDVLVNGTAQAPEGQPVERVRIGVKIGAWQKAFDVVGDRVWEQRAGQPWPSPGNSFTTLPITYDRAYGGVDDSEPERSSAYMENPVGRGYGIMRPAQRYVGRPLCNTEDPRHPVMQPWGAFRPMSLGAVGRGWQPRLGYAGTYDQNWTDHVFPFLPADFDERHYQAAPADQQMDEPKGGEEVIVVNLTPEGRTRFRLPFVEVPVAFFPHSGPAIRGRCALDTVLIEPDQQTMCVTWRASLPLRRNIFELAEVLVGHTSRAWWRARDLGKAYYPGLGAMVASRRAESGE